MTASGAFSDFIGPLSTLRQSRTIRHPRSAPKADIERTSPFFAQNRPGRSMATRSR